MRGAGIRTGDVFGIIIPQFAVFQLQLHVMPGPIVNWTKGLGKETKHCSSVKILVNASSVMMLMSKMIRSQCVKYLENLYGL